MRTEQRRHSRREPDSGSRKGRAGSRMAPAEADGRSQDGQTPARPAFGGSVPAVLAVAAIFVASLGGGMMGDRVVAAGAGAPSSLLGALGLLGVPLAMLLTAGAIGTTFWRTASGWRWTVPLVCVALFAVWCLLSLARTTYAYSGLLAAGYAGTAIALGAVTWALFRRTGDAEGLAVAATLAATLVAFVGLAEYLERWASGNAGWRVFGPFVNPDFLAGFLLMSVPLSAALWLSAGSREEPPPTERAVAYLVAASVAVVGLLVVLSTAVGVAFGRTAMASGAAQLLANLVRLAIAIDLAVVIVRASRRRDLARVARQGVSALAGIGMATQTACLLLTQSRLGVAALIVGLIAFAGLAVWGRTLTGAVRSRALTLVGLLVVAGLVGGRPLLHRLGASASESHSAVFRLYTWQGTLGMVRAHPVLGSGLGSYESTYPRYAIVDYTQHAHDSFLQLAAECGVPALALLAIGFVATVGVGVRALRDRDGLSAADRVLLAGLLGALVAAAAHNLFDSDLYIPANAIYLAALWGLALGLSRRRDAEVGVAAPDRRMITAVRAAAVCIAVLLASRGAQVAVGRADWSAAEAALADSPADGPSATSSLGSAVSIDGLNPEYRLRLANLLESAGEAGKAEEEYRAALRAAPIGKTCYRYAQFLTRVGRLPEAIPLFERARVLEPHNLQNLLALGKAYQAAQQPESAERVYRYMVDLRPTPFGRVRALPELVDWEFGIAYANLADLELARGATGAAEPDLREAAGILGEFWRTRGWEIVKLQVRPEVREMCNQRLEWVLQQWARVLDAEGRKAEADEARSRLQQFQSEKQAEAAASGAGSK